jgi:hypothetical protein
MAETCCGNNIRKGEEELLCWRTINCLINIHTQRKHTTLCGIPAAITCRSTAKSNVHNALLILWWQSLTNIKAKHCLTEHCLSVCYQLTHCIQMPANLTSWTMHYARGLCCSYYPFFGIHNLLSSVPSAPAFRFFQIKSRFSFRLQSVAQEAE